MCHLFPGEQLGAWLELGYSGGATGMQLFVGIGDPLKKKELCVVHEKEQMPLYCLVTILIDCQMAH